MSIIVNAFIRKLSKMEKEDCSIFQETSQSFGSILNLESTLGLARRRQDRQGQ